MRIIDIIAEVIAILPDLTDLSRRILSAASSSIPAANSSSRTDPSPEDTAFSARGIILSEMKRSYLARFSAVSPTGSASLSRAISGVSLMHRLRTASSNSGKLIG